MNVVLRGLAIIATLAIATMQMNAQSQTTGTLNLRNTQPATVSLSIPTTAVTGYTLLLPSSLGSAGQALTIQSLAGTTASLEWTNSAFWELGGTAITTGGTAPGQQYLGTSNTQDLVFATGGNEAARVMGIAGPRQGFVGIGTNLPQARLDVAGNMAITNSGTASELRMFEPFADGTNYTAFVAGAQTANVVYTLPPSTPTLDGSVLTATSGGVMSWTRPLKDMYRGIFTPVPGNWIHVIPIGQNLNNGTIPIVTMINPAGTTIGISVTGVDDVNNTVTVETSVALGAADRIAWIMVLPE